MKWRLRIILLLIPIIFFALAVGIPSDAASGPANQITTPNTADNTHIAKSLFMEEFVMKIALIQMC